MNYLFVLCDATQSQAVDYNFDHVIQIVMTVGVQS